MLLVQACSASRHAAAGDAGAGDAPGTSAGDAAQLDAGAGNTAADAATDGGVWLPEATGCGYTVTCIMGSTCEAAKPGDTEHRLADIGEASDSASAPCTCLRYEAVPCLGRNVVAAGLSQTCALVGDTVQCWGSNFHGQLGDGSTTRRLLPVSVSGLTGVIASVSAGYDHTCAIVDGAIKCWGSNALGQLGDGKSWTDEPESHVPVQVADLPATAQAIAIGGEHSCAIVNGAAWCWGGNDFGQLGTGFGSGSNRPVQVGIASGVQAIAAGADHSCAILHGEVWCWGNNSDGQLAAGTFGNAPVKAIASGARAVVAGAAHTCAIVDDGVVCWGSNEQGQLGDGTTTRRRVPIAVPGLETGVLGLAAGVSHTCALLAGGAVKCWGDNRLAQLGIGTFTTPVTAPTAVIELSPALAIFSGALHTCAITAGAVRCWGSNGDGQLAMDPNLGFVLSAPVTIPRLDCSGSPDVRCVQVLPGCADGSVDQVFDGEMVGCAGTTTFPERATLCGPGYQPATAAQWLAHHATTAPAHDYWTDEQLRYNGTGSSACFVSTAVGVDCGATTPMRVCTPSGADAEGNQCDWTNCGINIAAPSQFFGGCLGNTTAGTLCVPAP